MFNKKFKLICSAVGLVAVLLLLALPGTGEQPTGGLPSRADIKKGLDNAFTAVLTASGENIILDSDRAVFLSEFRETLAFVPLHDAYRPRARELMEALVEGQDVLVPIGGLYVGEPIKKLKGPKGSEFPLHPGAYLLKWTTDRTVAVVDQGGNTVGYVTGEIRLPTNKSKPVRPLILHSDQVDEDFLRLDIYTPWMAASASPGNQSGLILAGPIADFIGGFVLVLTLICACGK